MRGIITKGTTYCGRTLNAGEEVDIPVDDFQKLRLTGDIDPIPEPIPETHEEESPKPKKKK